MYLFNLFFHKKLKVRFCISLIYSRTIFFLFRLRFIFESARVLVTVFFQIVVRFLFAQIACSIFISLSRSYVWLFLQSLRRMLWLWLKMFHFPMETMLRIKYVHCIPVFTGINPYCFLITFICGSEKFAYNFRTNILLTFHTVSSVSYV